MDVLFDLSVNFIDEVEEILQEIVLVQPRNHQTTTASSSSSLHNHNHHSIQEHHERRAVEAGQARQEAEAILRDRRKAAASLTSTTTATAWRKEPVTFSGTDDAAILCRTVLAGVDPVLPEHDQLAAPPAVNTLTLRFSWAPRDCPATGSIASAHADLLALCVGGYRENTWQRRPGCYLVLDVRARSVSAAPSLPWFADILSQHCLIGSAGVAVLRTGDGDGGCGGGGFLLAELCRRFSGRVHARRFGDIPTNKATLFVWCSPGSGQWIRKEVVLPFPAPDHEDEDEDEDEDEYFFSFNAGSVFAVSSTAICWVDVWKGILICSNITSSISRTDDGDNGDGDGLEFRFIPLPEGCARSPYYNTAEHRAVCCVDSETTKLLIMDDGGEEVTAAVTTWTLRSPLAESGGWRWEKDEGASCSSLCVADLLDDAIPYDNGAGDGGGKHRLLRRVARCPVIGGARQPGVVHVTVLELEYRRKKDEWERTGSYGVSLDVPSRSVASVCAFDGSVGTHMAVLCTLE